MSPELDDALCRDFPLLYRTRRGRAGQTCMAFGFCCGDGWEPLIRRLSEKLEALIAELPDDEGRPTAFQVKEKFGGLRFYMSSETPEMSAAIKEAERAAAHTCEECSAPGRPRSGGWIQTLCDKCAAPSPSNDGETK